MPPGGTEKPMKIVYHEGYTVRYPTCAVENPARVLAIMNKLRPRYAVVSPEPASKEDVLRVHEPDHLIRVQLQSSVVYEAAFLAAGGAIRAAELAMEGEPAFAVIRPPGHHAGKNRFGGFCFFNNMAVALARLFAEKRIRRAAIVDIDMHQGDGTREIFAEDPRVTMIDIWHGQRQALMERLLDCILTLPPVDVIGVSAGFDLYENDWGACLTTQDFHRIGFAVFEAAAKMDHGRRFAILEGGYAVNELGKNALAFCLGLEGKDYPSETE
jgi:acetoin utilization deacetylase AcuC-like enzyme